MVERMILHANTVLWRVSQPENMSPVSFCMLFSQFYLDFVAQYHETLDLAKTISNSSHGMFLLHHVASCFYFKMRTKLNSKHFRGTLYVCICSELTELTRGVRELVVFAAVWVNQSVLTGPFAECSEWTSAKLSAAGGPSQTSV